MEISTEMVCINSDELKKNLAHYRKLMDFMACNVPITVLCLPSVIERALAAADCIQVYDLLDRDLSKIKGIGNERLAILTARLNESGFML